jgi:hypothetical protein
VWSRLPTPHCRSGICNGRSTLCPTNSARFFCSSASKACGMNRLCPFSTSRWVLFAPASRNHLPRSQARSSEPVRSTPFDPFRNAIECSPQHLYVFGQQHQAERQHPQPEQGKDAEKAADDQQNTSAYPQPALGGLAQPPRSRPPALGSRSINCSSRRSRRAVASLASQVSLGRSDLKSIPPVRLPMRNIDHQGWALVGF